MSGSDLQFSLKITCESAGNFSLKVEGGKVTPGLADLLLAVKVTENELLAMYYDAVNNQTGGVEAEVKKAE